MDPNGEIFYEKLEEGNRGLDFFLEKYDRLKIDEEARRGDILRRNR